MKKALKRLAMLSVAMLLVFAGCEKEPEKDLDDDTGSGLPEVLTNEVSTITANSAVCGGYVTSDGGNAVTERGVCWSTQPNPMVNNSITTNGKGTGSFTANIAGLSPNQTYYVRAYATNSKGTVYGEERSFRTQSNGGGTTAGLPTVETSTPTNVTTTSAVCGGNVTSDGGSTVTARGVCWSTSSNPTVYDNKTIDGSTLGQFTSNISGLQSNTTYYVRAYATNSQGTAYGTQKTFATETSGGGGAITGTINGHDYVDLDLPSGLKWATCNVGATTPEGYGNYYAWGETTTKTEYSIENSLTYYDSTIGDISGNPTYDAARANWGGTWRMPTKAEMEELVNNCTWILTTQNGVNGYKVTGPNGNSIFLPAAGAYDGSSRDFVGEDGYYWSSTPYESNCSYALFFYRGRHHVNWCGRDSGLTVRPVSE